jgi:hypothetical protein
MMRAALPLPLLVAAALAACGDSTTTVEFAEVCKTELDGKTLATTGYFQAPFAALCRGTQRRGGTATTCSFDLRDKPDGELRVSLNIEVGAGANRVDGAKLKAKQGAAAVFDASGKALADKARVRVTGALHAVPNSLKPEETICWLDVEKIERR